MKFHGLFGYSQFEQTQSIPIYILRGVVKKKFMRGLVVEGGGKYNIKKFVFSFRGKGVLDKRTFDGVMSGKVVKYSDVL